jgi:hypothetical protein
MIEENSFENLVGDRVYIEIFTYIQPTYIQPTRSRLNMTNPAPYSSSHSDQILAAFQSLRRVYFTLPMGEDSKPLTHVTYVETYTPEDFPSVFVSSFLVSRKDLTKSETRLREVFLPVFDRLHSFTISGKFGEYKNTKVKISVGEKINFKFYYNFGKGEGPEETCLEDLK